MKQQYTLAVAALISNISAKHLRHHRHHYDDSYVQFLDSSLFDDFKSYGQMDERDTQETYEAPEPVHVQAKVVPPKPV